VGAHVTGGSPVLAVGGKPNSFISAQGVNSSTIESHGKWSQTKYLYQAFLRFRENTLQS